MIDQNNPLSIPGRMELPTYEESLPEREVETARCAVCGDNITYGARITCEGCGAVVCGEHFHSLAAEYVDGPDKLVCGSCAEKWREQRKAA